MFEKFQKFMFVCSIVSIVSVVSALEGEEKDTEFNLDDLINLSISSGLGSIDEIWIPDDKYGLNITPSKGASSKKTTQGKQSIGGEKSPRIVLHIRDAHLIYEAQLNIADLLKQLYDAYGLHLVCVEGAWDRLDVSTFLKYTDALVRTRVLRSWLKDGRMNAAEYAATALNVPLLLHGIEESDLYSNNVEAFNNLYPYRNKAFYNTSLLDAQTKALQSAVFSTQLKDFASEVADFRSAKTVLTKFVRLINSRYIGSIKEIDHYPQIQRLQRQMQLEEKIDFGKAEEERNQFLREAAQKISKTQLKELIQMSFSYRLGKISSYDYYQHLTELVEPVFGSTERFKKELSNLAGFIEYEEMTNAIIARDLYQEIDEVIMSIYQDLALKDDELDLVKYRRSANLLKKLFQLELTTIEYEYYLVHQDEYALETVLKGIKKLSKKYRIPLKDGFALFDKEEMMKNLPYALGFYRFAKDRDEVLVSNLLKAMDEQETNVAILVLGGFHTNGIKKILQEKGIAYAVIMPNIQEGATYIPYTDRLLGKRPILEQYLERIKNVRNENAHVIDVKS